METTRITTPYQTTRKKRKTKEKKNKKRKGYHRIEKITTINKPSPRGNAITKAAARRHAAPGTQASRRSRANPEPRANL